MGVTGDMWHLTCNTWHLTRTPDMTCVVNIGGVGMFWQWGKGWITKLGIQSVTKVFACLHR